MLLTTHQKLSNQEDASNSQESLDVEQWRHLLAAKEDKLLESQRECADLKLTNVQLLNRAEVT
jgi:hypothetical protein